MESLLWDFFLYALIILYVGGFFMFSISGSLDGDDWWVPFVMPVVFPLWWLYENRIGMGVAVALLLTLIGIPVFISEVFL